MEFIIGHNKKWSRARLENRMYPINCFTPASSMVIKLDFLDGPQNMRLAMSDATLGNAAGCLFPMLAAVAQCWFGLIKLRITAPVQNYRFRVYGVSRVRNVQFIMCPEIMFDKMVFVRATEIQ